MKNRFALGLFLSLVAVAAMGAYRSYAPVTSGVGERVERAIITPTAAGNCTITSQSGSWLSSPTGNDVGDCTVTMAGFSATPACTLAPTGTYTYAAQAGIAYIYSISSTSLRIVNVFYDETPDTVAANTTPVHVICMGPR